MGWVWKDDSSNSQSGDVSDIGVSSPRSGDRCSTRKVVKSQCRTEEVEPGKFIRKCEKTEQTFKDCLGRPSEIVQSNKEYTEEDITDQMANGSFSSESLIEPFDFPGLRSDIESIERSFFGGINRFFEAAEDMRNGFFSVFGAPHDSDSSFKSNRRGIPIQGYPRKEASPETNNYDNNNNNSDGNVDLSGLARDV